jgi:hypothetical protein
MAITQSAPMPLRRRLNLMVTRWHHLIRLACTPYRPELHYMRGPGPKWRAKHRRLAEGGAL